MINGSSEYIALHAWIRRHKPRVDRCERCNCIPKNRIGKNGLVYNGLEVTNGGIYNKDFSNWEWLCRKCHYQKDREGWKVSEETKRKISLATKGKKRMNKRVIYYVRTAKGNLIYRKVS